MSPNDPSSISSQTPAEPGASLQSDASTPEALAIQTINRWHRSPRAFVTEALHVDRIELWQARVLDDIEGGASRISIRSGHGVGKALSVNEPVLTRFGWQPIGTIAVGDEIAAGDGSFCRVTGVWPQGERDLYKVQMDDGSYVIADADHLWTTTTRSERKHGLIGATRTTAEISQSLTFPNGPRPGLNHCIPTAGAVQHGESVLPIDPYTLGVWLGDGSRNSGRYTKPDETVAAELIAVGESFGTVSRTGQRTIHGIAGGLRLLGLFDKGSHERFVPTAYKHASISQRIAVLQGVLDTDGTVGGNQCVVLDTTAPQLAGDIAEIVRSLGGVCRRSERIGKLYDQEYRRVYRLYISLPASVAPFRAATKANRYRPRHDHKNRQRSVRRFIQSVTPVGRGEAVCITIDHPSELFLTRDHIVTHNSAILAWIVLWFMSTRHPAKAGCTAPTAHQLEDILWPEIALWHSRLEPELREKLKLTHLRLENADEPRLGFAVGRTARPEQPEALQGLHSPNALIVVDEASGVADSIFEVAAGVMSTPGAITVLAGNPTRMSGMFRDTHLRPGFCERWSRHHVSSEEVDRAAHHIEDIAARYGRDSNAFRVRVLGEFPTRDDDSVISLAACEAAVRRAGQVEPIRSVAPVWGLDVARFGDDRSALAKRCGNVLLEPVKAWQNKDTMQTAYLVQDEYAACDLDDRPARIYVDVIGVGAGVVDRMRELGLPVTGINVGEAAPANERYSRFRDELWFRGREWLLNGTSVLVDDRSLIAELCEPKYSFAATGKIVVERKQDLKDRGLPSPDLADAFLLTFAGGEHRRAEKPKEKRYSGRKPVTLSHMAA